MASSFATVNPATGETLKTYNYLSRDQYQAAIQAAHKDYQEWRKTTFAQRRMVLLQVAGLLKEYKPKMAELMNLEMGKLLNEANGEVDKCIKTFEYYANEAETMLASLDVKSPYAKSQITHQPLGVVFSIMPWNFPLWQVTRFAAPALMAGNVILLKHADLTAGVGELLEKIFTDLKMSQQLLRNLKVDHDQAADIIAHPLVRGVTFTGSTRGGREVATTAGKNLKKAVFELGGSDAYIVLADADIEKAAKACAETRLINCGQSCVAGKRFIVQRGVSEKFLATFVAEMKKAPLAPLASKKFQKGLGEQVAKLQKWGGKILLGGTMPEGPGAFYPATVALFEKNVPEIHNEEIFGPVASVILFDQDQEAMDIANSSIYGLGGGIFSGNVDKARAWVEKDMEAGFVTVNDYVKSDPHLPFGGVKESGYGRELGPVGIMEFVNVKTVAVGGG